MKRIQTFIAKVIIYKWLKLGSPSLYWMGIDTTKQSYIWFWEQSKNETNDWKNTSHLQM